MENRGSDGNDVKYSSDHGDGSKAPAKAPARVAELTKDNIAKEIPTKLPNMAKSSAPSGSPPNASLVLPPAAKIKGDDRRDVVHDRDRATKKLEHAPPSEPMHSPGAQMVYSLNSPMVVSASNQDIARGAITLPSSRNTAAHRTFRSPISSNGSREIINEESKQEEESPVSGVRDSNGMTALSNFYAVEAQLVPDGKEGGTVMVAEAQYVRMKWYHRPLYRWILLGSILFACGLLGAVVVLILRPPSAANNSSLTPPTPQPTMAPTTSKPTSLTPEQIACDFLSMPDVTDCRSTFEFDAGNAGDTTTGSTIPSEIGLLTQLTSLYFHGNSLTSTIPSEIGLLTKLTFLSFFTNELTSTIPSEIGLLTHLTFLDFYNNKLNSTIPSEIGLLTQLTALGFFINSLTSTIPSEIILLTQLRLLDFSTNLMTSTIPTEIGLLTTMENLVFANNLFTSTIPSEIGLLTQLTQLHFENNMLNGTIPSSLCSLPSFNWNIRVDCVEIACECCNCS